MKSFFRSLSKHILLICTIGPALALIATCFAPSVNPQDWWFFPLFALLFPFTWLLNLGLFVFWLMVRRKYALIPLVALLCAIPLIQDVLALNEAKPFITQKKKSDIRIMSWNVARFLEIAVNDNPKSKMRLEMMDLIHEYDADILCFQEFNTNFSPGYYKNDRYISKKLDYPYYYYCKNYDGSNIFTSAIFSRYPIVDSGYLSYPAPAATEELLFADIKVGKDTIRVYTTHLQSFYLKKNDLEAVEKLKRREEIDLSANKTVVAKLKQGFKGRSIQANIVRDALDESPYPEIFTADMNDVPNSYTYHTIIGDRQDAFLKASRGLGRTFMNLSPTLRIDVVFADPQYEVKQYKRIKKALSDHYPLVADLRLKKTEKN